MAIKVVFLLYPVRETKGRILRAYHEVTCSNL